MGEEKRKRQAGGRFQESITLDAVLAVFEQVEGPVITSSDVADVLDCSRKTAKRKLDTLGREDRIAGRETAGRTVWWRTDDAEEGEQ